MNKKTLIALLFFSTLVLIFGIFDQEEKYLQKKGNIFGTTFSITVNNIGDENLGEVEFSEGIGSQINHARNDLDALITTVEQRGDYKKNSHYEKE